jgi:nitrite reductase/ring-hydroxylating ferredoxin subunit
MKSPICPVKDIPADGGAKPVKFFDRDVLVYHVQGRPQAVFNACVHLGGPLERQGDQFVCPWHGARYDCASGRLASGPQGTHERLMVLPTVVEDGVLTYVYGE